MVTKMVDNIWDELLPFIHRDNFIFLTDRNVYNLYKYEINNLINGRENIYIMEPGEKSKGLQELTNVYKTLIRNSIDRQGMILSLGGGVVGDLAGFAAATYKRGINYIQIPTTLLAQVDSSIGGKTGIDFSGEKNIIGAFHFPSISLIYTSFIDTLPKKEITSGLGEIIKYGLIEDYDFFIYTIKNINKIYNRDKRILSSIINKSIEIKTSLYENDRFDQGIRQNLNFGHTVGHGIEALFNFEKYNHGEAVILGMIYETSIAYEKGLISKEYYEEVVSTLKPLVELKKFNEEQIELIIKHMKNDKKNKASNIRFILPTDKGIVNIFDDIDEMTIIKALTNI